MIKRICQLSWFPAPFFRPCLLRLRLPLSDRKDDSHRKISGAGFVLMVSLQRNAG